jgi:uncharacterized membrane protein
MRINEAGVFKWVIIVAIAGASVIGLTLLTRPLVGSIWGLLIVIAGSVYGIRWLREWQRNDPPGDR